MRSAADTVEFGTLRSSDDGVTTHMNIRVNPKYQDFRIADLTNGKIVERIRSIFGDPASVTTRVIIKFEERLIHSESVYEFIKYMMEHNMFPISSVTSNVGRVFTRAIFDYIFGGYTERELLWWKIEPVKLKGLEFTAFKHSDDLIEWAQKNAYSLPLIKNFQHTLYADSGRPRVNMQRYQVPVKQDHVISSVSFDGAATMPGFLPVIRYSQGDDILNSWWFSKQESWNQHGTFYYLEPQSDALLYCPKLLVATNKITALRQIDSLENITRIPMLKRVEREIGRVLDRETLAAYDILPEDGMMTPREYMTHRQQSPAGYGSVFYDMDPDKAYYVGDSLNLYSAEDGLDRLLYQLAQHYGYDAVLLTHMVGMYGIVSEVLDVRPRLESFDNLYFKAKCEICNEQMEALYKCIECDQYICSACKK